MIDLRTEDIVGDKLDLFEELAKIEVNLKIAISRLQDDDSELTTKLQRELNDALELKEDTRKAILYAVRSYGYPL